LNLSGKNSCSNSSGSSQVVTSSHQGGKGEKKKTEKVYL